MILSIKDIGAGSSEATTSDIEYMIHAVIIEGTNIANAILMDLRDTNRCRTTSKVTAGTANTILKISIPTAVPTVIDQPIL